MDKELRKNSETDMGESEYKELRDERDVSFDELENAPDDLVELFEEPPLLDLDFDEVRRANFRGELYYASSFEDQLGYGLQRRIGISFCQLLQVQGFLISECERAGVCFGQRITPNSERKRSFGFNFRTYFDG